MKPLSLTSSEMARTFSPETSASLASMECRSASYLSRSLESSCSFSEFLRSAMEPISRCSLSMSALSLSSRDLDSEEDFSSFIFRMATSARSWASSRSLSGMLFM